MSLMDGDEPVVSRASTRQADPPHILMPSRSTHSLNSMEEFETPEFGVTVRPDLTHITDRTSIYIHHKYTDLTRFELQVMK